MENMLTTRNRDLEQVLYKLGVHYISCGKDRDNMTVWHYADTTKTRTIMDWFRDSKEAHMKARGY